MKLVHEKIQQKSGRNSLIDIQFLEDRKIKPIIIFCHGFKGFKNWGHFDLITDAFAHTDFVFVKFNFSMNGTTEEQPTDFADLEAFGNNNFETELNELGNIIDHVEKKCRTIFRQQRRNLSNWAQSRRWRCYFENI